MVETKCKYCNETNVNKLHKQKTNNGKIVIFNLCKKCKSKQTLHFRGRIVSEITRKKLSVANTGFKHSIETKNKLSKINKGKKLSNKTKNKMSLYRKGRKLNKEWKLNMKNQLKKEWLEIN